jgi:hypothetical protein
MPYPIDPIPAPLDELVQQAFNALTAVEVALIRQIGAGLDATFNAVWSPTPPVTPQLMAAAAGNYFLARLQEHAAQATILLAQEAANGINSTPHPWAIPQYDVNGNLTGYVPGLPAGWTVVPTLDDNGNPTGAGTPTQTIQKS